MRKRPLGLLVSLALIAAACGEAAPTATPSPGGTGPADTPSADEQVIRMVMDGDVSGGLSNAADNVPSFEAAQLLYDGIYTYDADLTPQAGLAADLAEISSDGRVWTITLQSDIKFHDGSELSSADVVQNYQLAASPNCRYNPSVCLAAFLDDVEAVDELTVRFTLKEPLATFATVYLPAIWIDSKAAVDASYQRYLAKIQAVTAADTRALLDRVRAEEADPTGPAEEDEPTIDYAQFTDDATSLLNRADLELPDPANYTFDGVLDENGYAADLVTRVRAVDAAFTADRVDALSAAYPYLDYQLNPIGTGAFKFVSYQPGESIEFTRHDDYFKGRPEVARVLIPIIKDDLAGGRALAANQVDWKYSLEGSTYVQIQNETNLQFVEYPDFGFFSLYFNLRPGRLFEDVRLRQAVAYCFDKRETARVATEGQGVAIYSEIPPASWAFPDTGLETYEFNAAAGIDLLEEAGWELGPDGIRVKDGRRLSTVAAVRAGRANRSAFMELMRDQIRENCGIDIDYREVDFQGLLNMLDNFPHINAAAPETGQPFDAYFGGFGTSYDPDPYALYHSDECTTAERPTQYNFICYSNPEVDTLIEAGLREFDQDRRAEIYAEYAVLQALDLPVIYAWSDIAREGLVSTLGTTAAGGLRLDTVEWFWERHRLTNIR